MIPVPGIWVTLHRVGSDRAAPMDSVRADENGRYGFRYRRFGDTSAIYFASASYGGIAYFTAPFTNPRVAGDDAEIAVYDTTSKPIPIAVRGHHVVVSAVDANSQRSITEVFELANDSARTRIASGSGRGAASWSTIVPAGATGFQVAQGDLPPTGVTQRDGLVEVFAPIAPGLKQLAFSYSLPASRFPLSIPISEPTQILEVLIEEEKGTVTGARLKETNPVSVSNRTFRRFMGVDVPVNSVSVIDLPAARRATITSGYMIAITLLIAGAMAAALALALRRR
ncbi:MAG TPA: hypothetical protein VIF83_06840 [Gemmatimonadaceae bacterium]